jgi:hypothetical protein
MKTRGLLVILFAGVSLAGCNFFPEPAALIQAPNQEKAASYKEENMVQMVKGFLPKGTSLFVPNEPIGAEAYLKADLNNDGSEEVIAFYKSNLRADKTGALILQNKDGRWEQAQDIAGRGYEISWGGTADFTGDGKPELLLGWKVGVSAGSILDIYKWEDGMVKLSQQHFHKMDVILQNDVPRLALWKRESADLYEVQVLKWGKGSFVQDPEMYPSYFLKVADYYRQRTIELPESAIHWYYYAEALLRADRAEDALAAVDKGMTLNTTVPGWDQFEQLRSFIVKTIGESGDKDIQFYDPLADLTMNIPRELYPKLRFAAVEGETQNYLINVYKADQESEPLFSIDVRGRDFLPEEGLPMDVGAETEQLVYYVMRNHEEAEGMDQINDVISSIRLGAPFPVHQSIKDTLLITKIQEASQKASYVGIGGDVGTEGIQSLSINDLDYRYLGKDLDTKEKLDAFMGSSFTKEAIQSFIDTSRIIEHEGRLAQPNADGGSLLNYKRAYVSQMKDLGTEVQYDIKVPLGNSLAFETVQIVFKKTEEGWRISTNPVSL